MKKKMTLTGAAVILLGGLLLSIPISAQQTTQLHYRPNALSQDPACQSLTPTGAGGPAPKSPVVVLRWLGTANYELAYGSTVLLLDAYYDRPALYHPIGVSSKDFKRANAILIGHAHSDHISDAASVATQTGAQVVGASFGSDVVRKLGVPEAQIRTVKGVGGETLTFPGLRVEPILGRHNEIAGGYMAKVREASRAVALVPRTTADGKRIAVPPEMTPEQTKQAAEIASRGNSDPRIIAEGTIGYFITLDNGFRVMWIDSAGGTTDAQRAVAQRSPNVDVGLLPLYGFDLAIPLTMEFVRLFKPAVMMPTHHDGAPGSGFDMPTVPLFLRMREEFPKTKTIAPLYRTPVCINTATKEVFVGQ